MSTGYVLKDGMSSETLNGTKPTTALDKYPSVNTDSKYSARAVIDQYDKYDMPIGYFLPTTDMAAAMVRTATIRPAA